MCEIVMVTFASGTVGTVVHNVQYKLPSMHRVVGYCLRITRSSVWSFMSPRHDATINLSDGAHILVVSWQHDRIVAL